MGVEVIAAIRCVHRHLDAAAPTTIAILQEMVIV